LPQIVSRQIGPGRILVTVTTQSTPLLPANAILRLDFGPADNARIELVGAAAGADGGGTLVPVGPSGRFSLTPPAGSYTATFIVQRLEPGPFKMDYIVVDGCHESKPFTTFVGGGSGV
jgi:hypothetical protein